MADGPPPTMRSLLDRLRNHCRREGLDLTRASRHVAVLVVAQMADGIVVKGGRSLEARHGLARTRASTDLDLARTAGRWIEGGDVIVDRILVRPTGSIRALRRGVPEGIPSGAPCGRPAAWLASDGR